MKLIKIGGGKDINISAIASELCRLKDQYMVVLGANYFRDQIADRLHIAINRVQSTSGQTSVYTDENGIDVINMVYGGLRSKKTVEIFQQHGINAISISGSDGALIKGKRNKGVRIIENGKKMILHDYSGKPSEINKELLLILINSGYVPIISIPILDENNISINTDNDSIIRLLHSEFHFDEIYQFIEGEGIYHEYSDPASFIEELNIYGLKEVEEKLEGGIRRKLYEIRRILEIMPTKIYIGDGRIMNPLTNLLNGKSTKIRN